MKKQGFVEEVKQSITFIKSYDFVRCALYELGFGIAVLASYALCFTLFLLAYKPLLTAQPQFELIKAGQDIGVGALSMLGSTLQTFIWLSVGITIIGIILYTFAEALKRKEWDVLAKQEPIMQFVKQRIIWNIVFVALFVAVVYFGKVRIGVPIGLLIVLLYALLQYPFYLWQKNNILDRKREMWKQVLKHPFLILRTYAIIIAASVLVSLVFTTPTYLNQTLGAVTLIIGLIILSVWSKKYFAVVHG